MRTWPSLFGNDCQLVINDFDIAFFDAFSDRSQELTAKATLTAQFPDYKSDVKNQASFLRVGVPVTDLIAGLVGY
jgi:hypothetical protein